MVKEEKHDIGTGTRWTIPQDCVLGEGECNNSPKCPCKKVRGA